MIILWNFFLFIAGACLGSFAVAQTWRFRVAQKPSDKNLRYVKKDRSHCLTCGYQLKWFDLIPIISWLVLKGRCRQCRAKIGWLEITAELLLGLVFVGSYLCWPFSFSAWGIIMFIIWLISLVIMTILFIYDLKWSLLPSLGLQFLLICAILLLICNWLQGNFVVAQIWSLLGALAILPGVYFILYFVSKGRWVGSGDYILAFGLALILASWQLSFATLFLANLIGSIIGATGMITKKLGHKSHIPFGPLLIAAFLIIFFLQNWLLSLL